MKPLLVSAALVWVPWLLHAQQPRAELISHVVAPVLSQQGAADPATVAAARVTDHLTDRGSPGGAVAWSLAGTLVPIAAGIAAWYAQSPDTVYVRSSDGGSHHQYLPERSAVVPVLLALGGVVAGPAAGYVHSGQTERGVQGMGLRLAVTALTAAATYGVVTINQGWDGLELGVAVFMAGSTIVVGSAAWDVARVRHWAQRQSEGPQ